MNTIWYSNISSFLRVNFVVLSLGVHPKRVCQRGVLLCRKRKSPSTSKRCEIGCMLVLITKRKSHGLLNGTKICNLEWPWTAEWQSAPTIGRVVLLKYQYKSDWQAAVITLCLSCWSLRKCCVLMLAPYCQKCPTDMMLDGNPLFLRCKH